MIYGHRGASGAAPENTMEAYRVALEQQGADGVEIDVHYSRDGELVVMHDFDLSRTTDGSGMIYEKTLMELKKLSAGAHFAGGGFEQARIPTLEEVLEYIKARGSRINIELKAGSFFYPHIEEKVISLVHRYGLAERTLLSSFDHCAMQLAKEIDPEMKTGLLTSCRMVDTAQYVSHVGADAYNALFAALTSDVAAQLREAGLQMNCYTPNTPKEIAAMAKLGVDILITNYPDVARETVAKL